MTEDNNPSMTARDASLTMKLKAKSGFTSEVKVKEISSDQWRRILAITEEPETAA